MEFKEPVICPHRNCQVRESSKTTLLLGFEVISDLQGEHAWRVTAL
jgi:hypothetical protein